MKTLLVCASNSLMSINARVMDMVLRETPRDSLYLSKYTDIPILNRDFHDINEIPEDVEEIYSTLRSYECIVFFAPENNGYLSSFFKNIVDWLSLIERDFLRDKVIYLVSVSATQKESRTMEDSVERTFNLFSPREFNFINFREYGSERDKRNIEALVDKIFGRSR